MLAKRAEYINDHKLFSWPNMLPEIAEGIPKDINGQEFEFYGTFSGTLNPKLDHLRNVGPLDRPIWLEEVAKSKFMVCRLVLLAGMLRVRRAMADVRVAWRWKTLSFTVS